MFAHLARASRCLTIGAALCMVVAASADQHNKEATGKPSDLVTAMLESKIDLAKSLAEAESSTKGKALAMWVKMHDKHAIVLVHTAAGEKCMSVSIDPTCKATDAKDATADDEKHAHEGSAADIAKSMDASKMTLWKAIQAATEASKGVAICATTSLENGKLEIDVLCVKGDKLMECEVDAIGKVSEMAEVPWAAHSAEHMGGAKTESKEDKQADKKKDEKKDEKKP